MKSSRSRTISSHGTCGCSLRKILHWERSTNSAHSERHNCQEKMYMVATTAPKAPPVEALPLVEVGVADESSVMEQYAGHYQGPMYIDVTQLEIAPYQRPVSQQRVGNILKVYRPH